MVGRLLRTTQKYMIKGVLQHFMMQFVSTSIGYTPVFQKLSLNLYFLLKTSQAAEKSFTNILITCSPNNTQYH